MAVFWTPCRNSAEATASHKSETQLISCSPQRSSSCSCWVAGEVIWCRGPQELWGACAPSQPVAAKRPFCEGPRAPGPPLDSLGAAVWHWHRHKTYLCESLLASRQEPEARVSLGCDAQGPSLLPRCAAPCLPCFPLPFKHFMAAASPCSSHFQTLLGAFFTTTAYHVP